MAILQEIQITWLSRLSMKNMQLTQDKFATEMKQIFDRTAKTEEYIKSL